MCFSASASFGAGGVLAIISVAALKKAQGRSQIVFAGIPLLFCVQQITEGLLWLALSKQGFAVFRGPATFVFLFIAQVLWPLYVPVSILWLEKKPGRKVILKILAVTGVIISVYLAFCLFSYPVDAKIIGQHISYELDYPGGLGNYAGIIYFLGTVAPPFFSSIKRMGALGTAILISYIMTTIFYNDYIISVWCFFASVISMSVFAILYGIKHTSPGFDAHVIPPVASQQGK